MNKRLMIVGLGLWLLAALLPGCDEGQDDWSGSAKITGHVFTDASHTQGVEGVQVILESDPNSENPYYGPDRWAVTNNSGYFEKSVFLGRDPQNPDHYLYISDMSVAYFWRDKTLRWTGGITVAPGSFFTLPAVDTTMFQ
jgi:hypothetical protein